MRTFSNKILCQINMIFFFILIRLPIHVQFFEMQKYQLLFKKHAIKFSPNLKRKFNNKGHILQYAMYMFTFSLNKVVNHLKRMSPTRYIIKKSFTQNISTQTKKKKMYIPQS